jgi:hypothetical protein
VTTILLCTLATTIGLPIGYYLAWAWDQADAWMEQYLDGYGALYVWEWWR